MLLYRFNIRYKHNSKYQLSCTLCHDFHKIPLDKGCILFVRYKFLVDKPILMKFPDGKCKVRSVINCNQFMSLQSYPVIDDLLYKLLV